MIKSVTCLDMSARYNTKQEYMARCGLSGDGLQGGCGLCGEAGVRV